MPKVYTKKAAKDYPEHGISKGDTYYAWKFRVERKERKSKTYPRRSQLTNSSFLQTIYDLIDVTMPAATCADDLESMAGELDDAGNEAQSSLDNMPDGLQQGDTGQMLQTRVDSCSEWAEKFREKAEEIRSRAEEIEAWDKYREEIEGKSEDEIADIDKPDGEEPDEGETEESLVSAAIEELQGDEPDWG